MKRRDFIASIGAASTVSLLPNAAIARTALPASLLARAEHMASLWVHSSAAMFKNTFDLDHHTATQLFDTLTRRGIVGKANQYGVARATLPCFENPAFLAQRALVKPKVQTHSAVKSNPSDIRKDLQKLADHLDGTTEHEAQNEPS